MAGFDTQEVDHLLLCQLSLGIGNSLGVCESVAPVGGGGLQHFGLGRRKVRVDWVVVEGGGKKREVVFIDVCI